MLRGLEDKEPVRFDYDTPQEIPHIDEKLSASRGHCAPRGRRRGSEMGAGERGER